MTPPSSLDAIRRTFAGPGFSELPYLPLYWPYLYRWAADRAGGPVWVGEGVGYSCWEETWSVVWRECAARGDPLAPLLRDAAAPTTPLIRNCQAGRVPPPQPARRGRECEFPSSRLGKELLGQLYDAWHAERDPKGAASAANRFLRAALAANDDDLAEACLPELVRTLLRLGPFGKHGLRTRDASLSLLALAPSRPEACARFVGDLLLGDSREAFRLSRGIEGTIALIFELGGPEVAVAIGLEALDRHERSLGARSAESRVPRLFDDD